MNAKEGMTMKEEHPARSQINELIEWLDDELYDYDYTVNFMKINGKLEDLWDDGHSVGCCGVKRMQDAD
jgi:hypothetical protein